MPLPITPISPILSPELIRAEPLRSQPGQFQNLLEKAVSTIENANNEATKAVEKFLNGDGGELHTAAVATQKAELTFELGLQVRNKVVQAYQQIMQMQV